MGFWGWIITLFITSIILRLLRRVFKFIDWMAYVLIIGIFVLVWINEGFWVALITGIIAGIIIFILFGIGGGTKVYKFGNIYTLNCLKCGYEDLEIIKETELGVVVKCKRCDSVAHITLKH